ncbi:serine O-acetyltransferase [Nocardia sp. NPDC020380]|uniref:serine O-acetyltransferase n=1 Tax=Nocardia sp. NPDC020380 TaxID=3364309 RepID=UPI0037B49A16
MSEPATVESQILRDIEELVSSVADLVELARIEESTVLTHAQPVTATIASDLAALAARDPAAHGDQWYCYLSNLSFRALFTYRVAHTLYVLHLQRPPQSRSELPAAVTGGLSCAARVLSERAKARTGVEIHPAAVIGDRMVIDHGWGTVIGEQAQIGDDCYFLQNVVLGGRAIGLGLSATERRHPSIGDRVVIAGNAYVLGPVSIGDDCRIDAGARITSDVPAGSRVRVRAIQQVLQPVGSSTAVRSL